MFGGRNLKFANREGDLEDIEEIDLKIQTYIKPQLEDSEVLRNYDKQTGHVTEILKNFAVFNFVIFYSLTSALGPAVLWTHAMQLTTHYQLLKVRFPPNVSIFNHFLFMVVNFDAIEPSYSTDLIFRYQEYHT